MAKVPVGGKVAGYLLPFFLCFVAVDHLVPVFFNYGPADLTDDKADVVAGHPETLHQSLKVDACSEILEGDGQLQPWREGPPQVVNLASSSWNMAGSILSMFLNCLGSSFSSSTLRLSQQPNCSRRLSQGRTTSTSSSALLLLLLALWATAMSCRPAT